MQSVSKLKKWLLKCYKISTCELDFRITNVKYSNSVPAWSKSCSAWACSSFCWLMKESNLKYWNQPRVNNELSTISRLLPLPVLVQFEHVEEDLAGQAALAATTVGREKRRRRLQRWQTPTGGSHRVQRRPGIPATPRLAAALHRQMTAAVEKTHLAWT